MVAGASGPHKMPRDFVLFGFCEMFVRAEIRRRAAPSAQLSRPAAPMAIPVRTPTPAPDRSKRPPWLRPRVGSRFGYDHRWWGEAPPAQLQAEALDSYWLVTRRPLPCL